IGGYTAGNGSRKLLGSLLLGYWENKKLQFASHVGSGFDARSLKQVQGVLAQLQRKTCPFTEEPETNGPTTWVEPTTVAEVNFQNWTEDGALRAPVFVRLREDLDARSIRREKAPAPTSASRIGKYPPGRSERGGGEIAEILAQLDEAKKDCVLAVGRHSL